MTLHLTLNRERDKKAEKYKWEDEKHEITFFAFYCTLWYSSKVYPEPILWRQFHRYASEMKISRKAPTKIVPTYIVP